MEMMSKLCLFDGWCIIWPSNLKLFMFLLISVCNELLTCGNSNLTQLLKYKYTSVLDLYINYTSFLVIHIFMLRIKILFSKCLKIKVFFANTWIQFWMYKLLIITCKSIIIHSLNYLQLFTTISRDKSVKLAFKKLT